MTPHPTPPTTRAQASHAPVLVIGHDEACLEATRDALSFGRLVNPVLACDDLAELRNHLDSRDLPAVVVTELHLPDGTATDVLRLVRSNLALRRTPVVVVSDGASAEEIVEATALGATAVLDRGVAVDVLVGVLRDADLPWAISPSAPAPALPDNVRPLREVAR